MTVSYTPPFNLQNGTLADASQVMANFNAVTASLTTAASAGANNDITALNALSTPLTPAQGGTIVWFGTGGGAANAQTATASSPAGYALTAGRRVAYVATATNTGAATLQVNATAATALRKVTPAGLVALVGGEIISGQLVDTIYDGTFHVLLDNPLLQDGFSNPTNIASAATTQLGSAVGHSAIITGTTTITSFGNTGVIASLPFYQIKFSGALTLTHNAVSLILPGGANILTAANDTAVAMYLSGSNWQIIAYTRASGFAVKRVTPDFQKFLTGTGLTYTTPTDAVSGALPLYLRVRMIGGGGGGGASNTNAGANGTASSFGSWTADFGDGGGAGANGAGGAGGTGGTDSTGTVLRRINGGAGNGGNGGLGLGACSTFGGAGNTGTSGTYTGGAAVVNTGSGGTAGNGAGSTGGGGGAGEFAEFIITAVAASYTYTVGGAGNGGAAGGNAGGNGGSGRIEVEAYWQ